MITDFKILRGLSTELFDKQGNLIPTLVLELGCWYLCTDTADVFICVRDNEALTLKRINRGNVSIQTSYENALNYAKNNLIAYPGQLVSVGEELYVVTDAQSGYLQALFTTDLTDYVTFDDLRDALKDFSITDDNVVAGKDGIGITKAEINSNGELIITFSDDTVSNVGVVVGAKGEPGAQGVSITDVFLTPEGELTIALSSGQTTYLGNIKGQKGTDGKDGQDGKDGFSPIVEVTETANGRSIKITDENGEHAFEVTNGKDGTDGKDGVDGKDGIGITSSIINDNGELVINYTDGQTVNLGTIVGTDGENGADGKDGLTPFINDSGNWQIGDNDTGVKAAGQSDIIVLRNDKSVDWENSEYILLTGEVGISYLDNGNVIAKLGDGEHTWKDLPQIEGVFENEITLTHNFGRYKTNNGFVRTADAKGKTVSQWLVHALSETKEPTITQPTFNVSAGIKENKAEIGTYITTLNWTGTTTYGSYEYGPATGLSASNMEWEVSNNIDTSQKATTESGSFIVSSKNLQLKSEDSTEYAKITYKYKLNAENAAVPKNNVGADTSGKITSKEGTLEVAVNAEAYRKPFYGVLEPTDVIDVSALSSSAIRRLGTTHQSGTKTKGLPSSISVPIGSQMVIFAAKAGAYKTLAATDDKAMNATVSFEKVAKAVKVEGANGFDATDYDIWYVNWGAGIGSAKQLTLKWT